MNKFIRKDNMAFTKLKFMFELEVKQPMSLLFRRDDKIYLFKQFTILSLSESNQYKIESQFPLVRSTSKENLYHTEDLEFRDKIRVFRNNRFIAVGAYINGDIVVYSTNDGRKVEEQHSSPMNCLYVNEREDLLLCGCNNGLLEVYEIVYGEKDSLLLQKISAEYHMAPITSIGEGNNFYCICSGNLVMIHKIHRGLSYVYEKIKMKGLKMIRSV